MRKYALVVTDDEENNVLHMNRENKGFNGFELLGILDVITSDIRKQMTDQAFADKVIEHKRVVVDEE